MAVGAGLLSLDRKGCLERKRLGNTAVDGGFFYQHLLSGESQIQWLAGSILRLGQGESLRYLICLVRSGQVLSLIDVTNSS